MITTLGNFFKCYLKRLIYILLCKNFIFKYKYNQSSLDIGLKTDQQSDSLNIQTCNNWHYAVRVQVSIWIEYGFALLRLPTVIIDN